MKKLCLFLTILLCTLSCDKIGGLNVTCDGDCDDPTFIISGETGTSVTYTDFTSNYNYDDYGRVSKITFSGTITYNDSGNSYHVEGERNFYPCNYTVTVMDEDGREATCSN